MSENKAGKVEHINAVVKIYRSNEEINRRSCRDIRFSIPFINSNIASKIKNTHSSHMLTYLTGRTNLLTLELPDRHMHTHRGDDLAIMSLCEVDLLRRIKMGSYESAGVDREWFLKNKDITTSALKHQATLRSFDLQGYSLMAATYEIKRTPF